MNAYELADQVEMWGEDLLALNMKGGIPVVQGAKMLRQQADRIADLETTLAFKKMKPLSNEEIEKTFDNTFKVRDFEDAFLKFARAIEERHGIK